VKIEQIECPNHVTKIDQPELGLAKIALDESDKIPNKDFVLRYKVAGDKVKSGLMVQRDEKGDGGYFTLMVYPPESLKDLPRKSLEMVFTLDVSGSMSGEPIEQSRNAIRYALQHMDKNDTFQVIRFASSAEPLAPRALPATSENVVLGLKYIESMQAGGGTMMIEGIRQSLHFTPDENRLRFVALLTDGYIGNEVEILKEIHDTRNSTRIFSFGVGSSPNRFLLDNAARIGAGTVAYLGLKDDAKQVMAAYFERISHPALTDINVEWGGLTVDEVYPQKMPDLFVGRPVILTGHFTGKGAGNVKLVGKVGNEVRAMELPLNVQQAASHKGLAQVWARAKISEFCDRAIWQSDPNLPTQIRDVALTHGLMSAYTAFVAVDSSTQTAGDHGTTVAVPVPVPEGVKYETTVEEK
jgi:Ca-activated chloride channel family protein